MLSTEVEDLAAEWAMRGDVRMLLQKLLDRPYDEVLGVASVLPFGGLCDRHLVQLDALASHLETHFEASHSSSQFAMHVWLYHLLGGRRAGLTAAPTDDRRADVTREIGTLCTRHAQQYGKHLKSLKRQASKETVKDQRSRELAYIACMSSRSSMLVRTVRAKLGAAGTDGDADGERPTPKRDLSGEMPAESASKRAATKSLVRLAFDDNALEGTTRWEYGRVRKVHSGKELLDVDLDNGQQLRRTPLYDVVAVPLV